MGAPRTIVCVAASAGGVGALQRLLAALPADLPAAVVVVQHLSPDHPSALVDILDRAGPLPVRPAVDGAVPAEGVVLVGAPGRHVELDAAGTVVLGDAPAEHFVRPAADRLFASAAAAAGPRVVAVVLTGTGTDGALGARAVHDAGGVVVVQDPTSAEYDGMPRAALAAVADAHVLPLDDVAAALVDLTRTSGAP